MTLTQVQLYNDAIIELEKENHLMLLYVGRVAQHADDKGFSRFERSLGGMSSAVSSKDIPKEWMEK